MSDDQADQLGVTDAPMSTGDGVPCAQCAQANQGAVIAAVVIGVVAGGGLFYLFTRYGR